MWQRRKSSTAAIANYNDDRYHNHNASDRAAGCSD
jgi:hypothetical protein